MNLIQPLHRDEDLLRDISSARAETDELHIWWLGQSGFLLQWCGDHVVFDPYLSDALTDKYANTDKPHVRMTARCIDPARLGFVRVVTSSHNHTDHLDAATLLPMQRANPDLTLIIPEANRSFVMERLTGWTGEAPHGLEAGQSLRTGKFVFHGVPAAHNELEMDARGRHRFMGYVVEAGPWTVYHSGDTLLYDGMVEILKEWQVDVAILPINGNRPERRVAGNLEGPEAAKLAREIGAKLVIPCHFDMFEFNTVSPEEFESACRELGQNFQTLQCGERWSSSSLR